MSLVESADKRMIEKLTIAAEFEVGSKVFHTLDDVVVGFLIGFWQSLYRRGVLGLVGRCVSS